MALAEKTGSGATKKIVDAYRFSTFSFDIPLVRYPKQLD
jgi:hypothetical protein